VGTVGRHQFYLVFLSPLPLVRILPTTLSLFQMRCVRLLTAIRGRTRLKECPDLINAYTLQHDGEVGYRNTGTRVVR